MIDEPPAPQPTHAMEVGDAAGRSRTPFPSVFRHLLVNTLVAGITSSFLWFALTFWVYLETRSVVTTGVIAGTFSLASAVVGPLFGSYVDSHTKHASLVLATTVMLASFTTATVIFVTVDADDLLRLGSVWFWLLLASTMFGSVAGQARGIVLFTCVTLLVAEPDRDRANGMVGTVTGVSFAITSVFSGLVIGNLGMGWAYYLAVAFTAAALVDLFTIRIDEQAVPSTADTERVSAFDVRTATRAIRGVPGLSMLIALAAFNNLLGGVFMALMDAYGLELVSVGQWGVLWGVVSLAFIAGGLSVARVGLGSNPVRIILIGNMVNWIVCTIFPMRSSIAMLTVGMMIWMFSIPVIEAAEQTVLQRSIPYEQQGRVFGFAMLLENAAAPLTAFLVAPIAESVFIPTMTDGRGADAIGEWFGTGADRGLALMFVVAGVVGIIVTALAWRSRSYRQLTKVNPLPPVPVS